MGIFLQGAKGGLGNFRGLYLRTGKVVDTERAEHLRKQLRPSLGGGDETPRNKLLARGLPTPALLEEVTEDGPPNSCINLLRLPPTCPCGCLARASASPSTHGDPGQWMAGAAHPMWKPQEALAGALLVTVGSPGKCASCSKPSESCFQVLHSHSELVFSSFGLNRAT